MHWAAGVPGFGPLVYCDFMPQQFGFDRAGVIKLLDVEGVVPLRGRRLFDAKPCAVDADCVHRGCYKAPALWAAPGAATPGAAAAADAAARIDELRCNASARVCVGIGVEYNVYALSEVLLRPLLGSALGELPPGSDTWRTLQAAVEAALREASAPTLAARSTAAQLRASLVALRDTWRSLLRPL